jgi:hypothetical protein
MFLISDCQKLVYPLRSTFHTCLYIIHLLIAEKYSQLEYPFMVKDNYRQTCFDITTTIVNRKDKLLVLIASIDSCSNHHPSYSSKSLLHKIHVFRQAINNLINMILMMRECKIGFPKHPTIVGYLSHLFWILSNPIQRF